MRAQPKTAKLPPLELSKWRTLPARLMVVGAMVVIIGLLVSLFYKHDGGQQFANCWLLAFMFCLSICLGALFLVLAHHLFDAGWSVPIRRVCEHIASLLPYMFFAFLPIGLMSKRIYSWMSSNPAKDHALAAKQPLFTVPMFWVSAVFCFLVWWWLTNRLSFWSLEQDKTGEAKPTHRMRFYS